MRRLLRSVITVLVLAQASMTLAQSDPGRDAEARGLFEAGRAAFDQGRYPDALGYFDRAYQLSRRAQLLYNIGQVHDRLRHDEEALQAFQQYLKQVPGAENRVEVQHRIEALRQAMVGTLHFTIAPNGAQVWIDGEAKTIDNTGRIEVSTGSHEILVRAQGYDELRQRMNVRGGDMIELPITLQPSDGSAAPAVTPASVITTTPTQPSVVEPPSNPSVIQPPQTPAVTEPAAPTQPPVDHSLNAQPSGGMSTATTLGLITGGSAVLFLAAGGIATLVGAGEFTDLENKCTGTCTDAEIADEQGRFDTYALVTNVGLIGGGALAGLAVLLLVVGGGSSDEPPPAQPSLVIGPTSIMAQGSF